MTFDEPDYFSMSDLQSRWNCSETALFSLIWTEELKPLVPIFRIHFSNERARAYFDVPGDDPDAHAVLRETLNEASKRNIESEIDEIFGPEPIHDLIEKLFRPASTEWIATHSGSEIADRVLFSRTDIERFERDRSASNAPKVENKQAIQCKAIMDTLRELGFDPTQLPRTRGQAGPKRLVRDRLLRNKRLFTDNSFDKAWDRLRSDNQIKNC